MGGKNRIDQFSSFLVFVQEVQWKEEYRVVPLVFHR